MTAGNQPSSSGSAPVLTEELRDIANQIAEKAAGWLPISGHVVNITFSLRERDLIVAALHAQSLHSGSDAQGAVSCGAGLLETNPALFDILNSALGTMHYHRLMSALNWNGYQIVRTDALSVVTPSPGPREWRSIDENTPRDGTPIEACNTRHPSHAPVVVRWKACGFSDVLSDPYWCDAATADGSALYFNENFFDFWKPTTALPASSPVPSTHRSPPAATAGDIPSGSRPPASAAMGLSAGGEPTYIWPAGCHSPNSCHSNKRCMYVGCRHDGTAAMTSATSGGAAK